MASNKEPLEDRIRSLEKECTRYIQEYTRRTSPNGVPAVVAESMLMRGGNAFEACLQVIKTEKRDELIARAQSA